MDSVDQAMHRLLRTVQTAGAGDDPGARAEAAHRVITAISQQGELRSQLAATRREAVNQLREQGQSLGDIAERLGVSRGTVQQISEGRSSGRVRRNRQPVIGSVFPR